VAYSVAQIIGHEFLTLPSISDIMNSVSGTVENSIEIYEDREEIKEETLELIEILKEKKFQDYVDLILG
jgi:hypothetical protein